MTSITRNNYHNIDLTGVHHLIFEDIFFSALYDLKDVEYLEIRCHLPFDIEKLDLKKVKRLKLFISSEANSLSKLDFKDIEELTLVYSYNNNSDRLYNFINPKFLIPRFTYAGQSIEDKHQGKPTLGQVYVKTDTRMLDKVDLLTRQIETVTDSHRETVDRLTKQIETDNASHRETVDKLTRQIDTLNANLAAVVQHISMNR